MLGVGKRIEVRQVRQRHGADRFSADHLERPVVVAHHPEALGRRPQHHEGVDDGFGGAGGAHLGGHAADELREPVAGHPRDPQLDQVIGHVQVGRSHVGSGADHDARPLQQLRAVVAELAQQHLELLAGRCRGIGRQVDQQDQHPGPLDVAQELVAEAPTLAGALDEAGDVGDHELGVVGPHHAEVGFERREGVVGDLGLGGGDT